MKTCGFSSVVLSLSLSLINWRLPLLHPRSQNSQRAPAAKLFHKDALDAICSLNFRKKTPLLYIFFIAFTVRFTWHLSTCVMLNLTFVILWMVTSRRPRVHFLGFWDAIARVIRTHIYAKNYLRKEATSHDSRTTMGTYQICCQYLKCTRAINLLYDHGSATYDQIKYLQ